MRFVYAMSFVVLGAALALWLLLPDAPAPKSEPAVAEAPDVATTEAVAESPAPDPVEEERDRRLEAMRGEYVVLEQERDALADDLKALQRGLAAAELPVETKRSMTQELGRISFYVGNPKMLGAFKDAGGIRDYVEEIKRARARLAAMADDIKTP